MIEITWPQLRDAIKTYLEFAYPDGVVPDVVRQRAQLDECRSIRDVVLVAPFENYSSRVPFPCTVHALRLGSREYPHIKLEIRPFPGSGGFIFWVNTHDQFIAPRNNMPDADRWRAVVQRNRDLKQDVERAWARQGLPTFMTAMREAAD